MKFTSTNRHPHAFTRMELFVVMAIIAVLLSMLAAALSKPKFKYSAVKCSSNLKQIVLSARMFAGDNNEFYPFGTTNSYAYQNTDAAWRHFMTMSNELGSVRILVCPLDPERATNYASTFGDSRDPRLPSLEKRENSAISYFIALRNQQGQGTNKQGILFGDRFVSNPNKPLVGPLLSVKQGDQLQWDGRDHKKAYNLAFEDGSVMQVSDSKRYSASESDVVDFLLPVSP